MSGGDAEAKAAIKLWKGGSTRAEAIGAMPRGGCGRHKWDCLLGCSDDRGPADCPCAVGPLDHSPLPRPCCQREQLASTVSGLTTSLTELGCCLGGAFSAVAVMLVLDEDLLLL